MATVTKNELRKKLAHREQIAISTSSRPKHAWINEHKNANLARRFLKDYSMFKEHFDMFNENQCFTLIQDRTSYNYKNKDNTIILFDSFTITLLQIDNNFFLSYCRVYVKVKKALKGKCRMQVLLSVFS